jgi:PPOX class probable F420-dependent enzyme
MATDSTTSAKDAAIFEQKPPMRSLQRDELLTYLAAGSMGVFATINANGFPHLSTVIYSWDVEAGVIRISTRANRAKAKNAVRDAHGALFVEGLDKWSFVVAEGDIQVSAVSTTPGDETGQELLTIFPQADADAEAAFLAEQVSEERVVLRVLVSRLYGDIIELTPPTD